MFQINPDHVGFKIINSSNHITYSRVMKSTGENYACLKNCGIFDRKTNTVRKAEKPLKLNLLPNKKIEKREKLHENNKKNKLRENRATENLDMESMKSYISHHFARLQSTTHPPSCKNLQHNHELDDDFDEEIVDNDSELIVI